MNVIDMNGVRVTGFEPARCPRAVISNQGLVPVASKTTAFTDFATPACGIDFGSVEGGMCLLAENTAHTALSSTYSVHDRCSVQD